MSILAALSALLFGLCWIVALAVLAYAGRRAFFAWGELARALESGSKGRAVRFTVRDTGFPPARLRLVEGGVSYLRATDHGLREAA